MTHVRFWLGASALTVVAIAAAMSCPVQAAAVVVVENPEQFDSGFFPEPDLWRQYEVYNRSDVEGPPINVLAVVVTNSQPGTEWIRGDWNAADLNTEEDWDAPMLTFDDMGGVGEGLSWREFYGGAAFPGPANGYYLEYVVNDGALSFKNNPIGPGQSSIKQLWFKGPLASDFLVAAAPTALGLSGLAPSAMSVIVGTAAVPEAASLTLVATALLAAWGLGRSRRR